MTALYELIFLFRDHGDVVATLRDDVRAFLNRSRISEAVLRILENPEPDSVSEDAVKAAVFVGSPKAAADSSLLSRLEQFSARHVPTIPLLVSGNFSEMFPPLLHPINALQWRSNDREGVALQLLRFLGLTEKQRRVFVSYRRSDALHIGEQIWTTLSKAGFHVFLDRFSIEPGDDFQARLTDQLSNKSFVLFIESPEAVDSPWVLHEVNFARLHRLGLLVLTWPETISRGKKVPGLYERYRYILRAADFIDVDRTKQLSESFLATLPTMVEQRHAAAMLRRRRQLLGSVLREAERLSLQSTQLSDWTVLISDPSNNSRLVSVLPRPPEVPDLYLLDENRRSRSEPITHSWLVHAASHLPPDQKKTLDWVIGERDISISSEDKIVRILSEIADGTA